DLVVDIGDVADVVDVPAEELEAAPDRVESDRRVRVTDVRRGIRRRPTDIDADLARNERLELRLLAAHRIVEAERRSHVALCSISARSAARSDCRQLHWSA